MRCARCTTKPQKQAAIDRQLIELHQLTLQHSSVIMWKMQYTAPSLPDASYARLAISTTDYDHLTEYWYRLMRALSVNPSASAVLHTGVTGPY